jgi:hypothetical protein
LELWLFLPASEGCRSDSNGLRGIFHRTLSEQGSGGGLLFMRELCSVTAHLRSPAIICASQGHRSSPFHRLELQRILLAFPSDQSDSCDRGDTANKGENVMISTAEALETALAPVADAPKATQKASVAKPARNVAPKKGKSGTKATPAKKAPKAPKAAKKATGSREGSKTATILDLLKRKDGATLKELMKVSGWQAHSVRGFLSGTVGKKLGLAITSTKAEDGERSYSVKA